VSGFLSRSFPILFQQQIYNCQAFIQSLNIQIVTYHFRTVLLSFIFIIVGLIFIRVGLIIFRIKKLKKQSLPSSRYPKSLTKLLVRYQVFSNFCLVDNEQPLAFCFGVLRPTIFFSSALLKVMKKSEIEAILLHERYHLHHHDSLTLFIATVFSMSFPFFPLLSDLILKYRLTSEIKADQAAIQLLGTKAPLISVLKKMLLRTQEPGLLAVGIANYALSSRIHFLVLDEEQKISISRKNAVISLLSTTVLLILVFMPLNQLKFEFPSEDNTICIGGGNCAVRCSASPSEHLPMSRQPQFSAPQSLLPL